MGNECEEEGGLEGGILVVGTVAKEIEKAGCEEGSNNDKNILNEEDLSLTKGNREKSGKM